MKIPLLGASPFQSLCPTWLLKTSEEAAVVTCQAVSAESAATDEGLIDGAVNKCQGSLPASAARGVGDEEMEVERLI